MKFVRKIIFWLVGLPVALIVAGFSVANRNMINVNFDPFDPTNPFYSLEMPLYIFMLICFLSGFVVGGLFIWNTQRKWRNEARFRRFDANQQQHEIDFYKRKAKKANSNMASLPAPISNPK